MDTRAIARRFASRMIAHRNALAGKAEDAMQVQFALHQAASMLDEHRDAQRKAAGQVLENWEGARAEQFEKKSDRLARQIKLTSASSTQAEKVVAGVTGTLTSGHTAAQRLIDEYVEKVTPALETAVKSGDRAAMMKAVAAAADLEPEYARESAGNLRRVKGELDDAARRLRGLAREIEDDGVADPRTRRTQDGRKKHGDGTTRPTAARGRVRKIVSAARGEIGTRENPPGSNRNPYGPDTFWCSSFATAMWRRAGVDIPILPFTGDVYRWGQRNGKAYGNGNLSRNVRPGDVLLFGTGPESPQTSKHIGIVEKVDGNTVTLIEGNSGDAVRRNTHQLSSTTFYGGVHP